MPRPVTLMTSPWSDHSLQSLVTWASEWNYQGLELCCWTEHLDVHRCLDEPDYSAQVLDLLSRHDLNVVIVAQHRVSHAISDPGGDHLRPLLPEYVWGDGKASKVSQRAADELMATFRVAEKLGAPVVSGFTGNPLRGYVGGYPWPDQETVMAAVKSWAKTWNPILDVARDSGVKFALEVHPGQLAFDLYSAELVLDALHGREEFGFTFDPSHFFWQGIEPVEFLRRFADRIYHVHIKDAILTLNGRTGILSEYWPSGDPRRGWQFRSPGRGGIDWEPIIRGLNEIGYTGALSVDWHDSGMDKNFGAADAWQFISRIDFDPPASLENPFRDA